MVFGVYSFIDHKRVRLRSEIRENIENLFEGQSSGDMFVSNDDGFFDVAYSGSPVRHFKKVAIPSKPTKGGLAAIDPSIDEKIGDDWKQSYGDLASLYELNWGDNYPNSEDDGWSIIRIYCGGTDDDFIQTNTIFPYKVGMKKTEWGNFYTVEQAVNEAFEFYSTNPKSSMAEGITLSSANNKADATESVTPSSANNKANATERVSPAGMQLKVYFGEMRYDLPKAEPGTVLSDGKTYFAIATADGAIAITDLQLAGKKRMDVKSFLLGFRNPTAYVATQGTSVAEIAKAAPKEDE